MFPEQENNIIGSIVYVVSNVSDVKTNCRIVCNVNIINYVHLPNKQTNQSINQGINVGMPKLESDQRFAVNLFSCNSVSNVSIVSIVYVVSNVSDVKTNFRVVCNVNIINYMHLPNEQTNQSINQEINVDIPTLESDQRFAVNFIDVEHSLTSVCQKANSSSQY